MDGRDNLGFIAEEGSPSQAVVAEDQENKGHHSSSENEKYTSESIDRAFAAIDMVEFMLKLNDLLLMILALFSYFRLNEL